MSASIGALRSSKNRKARGLHDFCLFTQWEIPVLFRLVCLPGYISVLLRYVSWRVNFQEYERNAENGVIVNYLWLGSVVRRTAITYVFKGAQAWDIRERIFYTNQTCTGRWLGAWRKKMKFRKLECLFEGFRYEYLIKRTISMRLITKKIWDSPPKKGCVRCLRDPHLKFKKDFKFFFVLRFLWLFI